MEPMIVTVDPKEEEKEPSFHSHVGQEFQYVFEGRLQIMINHDEIVLEPIVKEHEPPLLEAMVAGSNV